MKARSNSFMLLTLVSCSRSLNKLVFRLQGLCAFFIFSPVHFSLLVLKLYQVLLMPQKLFGFFPGEL